MKVRIKVTGKSGCFAQDVVEVKEEGDLAAAIGAVFAEFRRKCGESTFDSTTRVEHA
jgi:hypothetical protein